MSLLRKFAILLGLFAATVIVGLGASLVFGAVLEREVAQPFRATTAALTDLSRLKRSVGLVELLVIDQPSPETLEGALAMVRENLTAAESAPQFDEMVGPASARNLRLRVEESARLTREWLDAPTETNAEATRSALFAIHEVIEAIEQRVLTDAERSADFGDEMRRLHHLTLFAGMLSSGLFGLLGVMLLRRWVLAPVATLGEATQRIAAGEFAHRVSIPGGDELAALGGQVNAMAGSIATMQHEAVERERLAAVGEMVRRLAHNLRNPLAGIRNLAELSSMRSADNPQVKELQGEIIASIDRFNGWLKELLNVTSPMRVHPVEHEVRPWIEGIVAAHAPLARMRSVTIDTDLESAPVRAVFDAKHLEHAVVAILTNAIQASPQGASVRVRVGKTGGPEADALPAGWWEVSVRDEGPGIPDDARERIFRPYFTTKRDGNGIGLAVALQAVKRHKGRIDLWTQPNRGTCFSVRLPPDPPASGEE